MAAKEVLDLKSNLRPGDLIEGRYKVEQKLGEGGCGSVYRCTLVQRPDEEVAVKLLENPNDLVRFQREIEVLRGTKSAHVVGFRHYGKHLQFPYLAMEYLAGASLRDYLDKKKRIPVKEACWIIVQAIKGLRDSATVHRDLKPENLLLTKAASGRVEFLIGDLKKGSVVKLADFGLAKAFDPLRSRLTNTGQIMGTPLYMSPEQCTSTRDVNAKSDIYSLGVILFELITGECPFNADDPYTLIKLHNEAEARYPARMDQQVQAVLKRCLQKKPAARYSGLDDLESDLAIIAGIKKGRRRQLIEDGHPQLVKWTAIICGMVLFITVSWLYHARVVSAINDWWSPPPKPPSPAAPAPRPPATAPR